MKLPTILLLHPFCKTLLSERGESNKTNANKVLYKAPLTRKTRLKTVDAIRLSLIAVDSHSFHLFFERGKVIRFHQVSSG